MGEILLGDNLSFNITTTTIRSSTTSSIPYREQILIDAFNSYIQIGIGSLLFLFGLTFNCLSLLYFHVSRSFRQTTFRLYFSIIAILDTIRLFEFLIFILFDKGYLKVTLTLCRLIFFTIMFTGQASIWLTVALAIEKCIIIWFPIKGRLCFTMLISKIVLVLVLCLVLAADIIYLLPTFFLHTYENMSIHTFMCVWQKDSQSVNVNDQWKKHYLTFNTVFFHSIIPSIILLIVNWLILCSLSRQRVVLAKIATLDAKNVLKREKQFKEKIIQLVLSSFFVIITISPRYVLTMVNAFATNISRAPFMPLYVYVNLNIVFRVLEMCNYSLNIIFAILSGRTSRLEIRKLLWEWLFWRCKRTQADHHEMKYPAHAFLFEDDDDSVQPLGPSSSCPLPVPSTNRPNNLTPKASSDNYSIRQSRMSTAARILTCCGFTIDLSHSQPTSSSSKSFVDDSLTRRSTINKKPNPLSKTSSCPQASLLPDDGKFRQQKTVCYRSNYIYRPNTRRRATTVVHCSSKTPSSAPTTLTLTENPSLHRSTSKEKQYLNIDKLSPIIDTPSTPKDGFKTFPNLIEPPILLQTDCDDPQSSAYIIETC